MIRLGKRVDHSPTEPHPEEPFFIVAIAGCAGNNVPQIGKRFIQLPMLSGRPTELAWVVQSE